MRKERTLLVLGVWVALLPFLGFPDVWRRLLFVATGLGIVLLAVAFYRKAKERMVREDDRMHPYMDNIQK